MAYVNTGYQRSLTLVVKKYVNSSESSRTVYNGKLAFSIGQKSYGAISDTTLVQMDQSAYEDRLNDFIEYVEQQVPGLVVADVTEEGSEARRYNTTSCPFGK